MNRDSLTRRRLLQMGTVAAGFAFHPPGIWANWNAPYAKRHDSISETQKIKIIGVGGTGGEVINQIICCGLPGTELIHAHSDAQSLARSKAHLVIQLGRSGLYASKPNKGRLAAEVAETDIREAIADANFLIIVAGMGGGTGTGSAPVVASIAREMGIPTVAVVSTPHDSKSYVRFLFASSGLTNLERTADSLIVIPADRLPLCTGAAALYSCLTDMMKIVVDGIARTVHASSLDDGNFADVRTVMGEPGMAAIGTASASGTFRAHIAAEQALTGPLLGGVDVSGAKGVLVFLRAAKDSLTRADYRTAMTTIRKLTGPEVRIVGRTWLDDRLSETINITLVAFGMPGIQAALSPDLSDHFKFSQPGEQEKWSRFL